MGLLSKMVHLVFQKLYVSETIIRIASWGPNSIRVVHMGPSGEGALSGFV